MNSLKLIYVKTRKSQTDICLLARQPFDQSPEKASSFTARPFFISSRKLCVVNLYNSYNACLDNSGLFISYKIASQSSSGLVSSGPSSIMPDEALSFFHDGKSSLTTPKITVFFNNSLKAVKSLRHARCAATRSHVDSTREAKLG